MMPYLAQLGIVAAALTTSWDLTLWKPSHREGGCEVQRVRDIAYCKTPDDSDRHCLDLYVPKNRKDFPVIVLVHGGAWCMGDNRCCGLYSSVGEYFASRGLGVVLPNYRLSPDVKHPEHVKDVAKAVAWTQQHIGEYGGNPHELFLVGHSAGGHLVALLATDPKYLEAEGVKPECLRGIVGVSGVYRIAPGKVEATLFGSFRFDQVFPMRTTNSKPGGGFGIPMSVNVYGIGFGDDLKIRADASPINHVRAGLPPFLLLNAENDLPTLARQSEEFCRTLKERRIEVSRSVIADRNHNSVFFCAIQPSDTVARAIEAFVNQHRGKR